MIAYQLSVHAENKPGQLAGVTALLARAGISIRATTITTFGQTGIINLIVDEPVSYTHLSCRRSTLCNSRWSPHH